MSNKIKYNTEVVKSVFEVNPKADRVLVTSDGNVFLADSGGKNYCVNHCRENKCEFEEITRNEFEKGSTDSDWKKGKFNEIVEFAKSKGFTPETKSNEGKPALVTEVEAFLLTLTEKDND